MWIRRFLVVIVLGVLTTGCGQDDPAETPTPAPEPVPAVTTPEPAASVPASPETQPTDTGETPSAPADTPETTTTATPENVEEPKSFGRFKQNDVELEIVDGWATWDAKFKRLSIFMSPTRLSGTDIAELEGRKWNVPFPELTPPDGWNHYPFSKLHFDFNSEAIDIADTHRMSLYANHFERSGQNVTVLNSPQTDPSLIISNLTVTERDGRKFVELDSGNGGEIPDGVLSKRFAFQWKVSGSFPLYDVE